MRRILLGIDGLLLWQKGSPLIHFWSFSRRFHERQLVGTRATTTNEPWSHDCTLRLPLSGIHVTTGETPPPGWHCRAAQIHRSVVSTLVALSQLRARHWDTHPEQDGDEEGLPTPAAGNPSQLLPYGFTRTGLRVVSVLSASLPFRRLYAKLNSTSRGGPRSVFNHITMGGPHMHIVHMWAPPLYISPS
jgi:hypothetical protein